MAGWDMLIRLRYWAAMLVAGGVAAGISIQMDTSADDPAVLQNEASAALTVDTAPATDMPDDEAAPAVAPLPIWSKVVGPGDSVSGLLTEAGLDKETSRAVTGALGSAFDLQHIQPGHVLSLGLKADGTPRTATLEIEDGSRIQATFGPTPSVDRLAPQLTSVRRAGEATVDSSIFAALDRAGMPTRFATDLELILAETFDLRAHLGGGEHIRLMWREFRSGDRVVGDPTIDYAQLDLTDGRYQIMWPDDNSRQTRIFKDGELLKTFDQPIRGARLSSSFGMRMHPVHGTMRMHSGLDFAAPQGSVVEATQKGRVAYMGKRSGYGTVVELDHGRGVMTRYAHLSALNDKLKVGQRVNAGTELGRAGSTGTSTAPHLHYEIRINGEAVSPLADTRLRQPDGDTRTAEPLALVDTMQNEMARLIAAKG
ncbi:M23 family metallopeptidase [Loktanella atrilutea]|nr:M23 family metallopeptidase [Loktanella atrilutea]